MGGRDDTKDAGSDSDEAFLRDVARIDEAPPERAAGVRVGHFVLRGELGRGGMGIVYRADDEKLARTVALKVLPGGKESDPHRRARFLREARSAASLVHANVAAIYEIGDADGSLYIAMELVVGESLRARLLSRKQLAIDEAIRIAKGIARGLAAAHAKGIIHRDLKPENVMLDVEGEPKILDFGLAKLRATHETPRDVLEQQATDAVLTEEGLLLGTPGYMSPEQARGKDVDARSDVFSFGVMLYEMIGGIRPFVGASAMDVAIATARDEAPPLSKLNASVPAEVESLVATCLAKAPDARFATAREILDALQAIDASSDGPHSRGSGRRDARVISTRTDLAVTAAHGRSSVRIAIAFSIAAALGLGTVFWKTRAPRATPLSSTSAAVDSGSPRPRALTEYPHPKAENPVAAAAYVSALQSLRDGSLTNANIDLERATALEPTFAAAQLRLMIDWGDGSPERYAAASQFRAALDARDRMLLLPAEAMTHDPIDWNEVAARLHAALERFPDDPETLFAFGMILLNTDRLPESRAAFERALAIDPEFAGAIWGISQTYQNAGDDEQTLRVVDRCLALQPSAASCLRIRALIAQSRGQCDTYEAAARQMIAMEPKGPRAHWFLADAIAVRGASVESVTTVLEKKSALIVAIDPTHAPNTKAGNDLALGGLTGDFPRLEESQHVVERLDANESSEAGHTTQALNLIMVAEEEGDRARALSIAESFVQRGAAWTPNDSSVRLYLLFARHHAGRISLAELQKGVAAIEQDNLARAAHRDAADVRIIDHGRYAEGDEIADALRYVDRPSPNVDLEAIRGRLLLAAGRVDEAIPPLRRAAGVCRILPVDGGGSWQGYQAFGYMRSHLWLGQALEARGDKAGACEAYGVVTTRWKNAKPRSITLEKAKERARALACP